MTWIRILLVILLITENLMIPLGYVYATEHEPVILINYQSKDRITPESSEYVTQVNNARPDDNPYNFYTLSGVVKTVKATEKGDDNKYYHTGDGAPGYLVVAYDRISGKSLAYKDWIAATTTNENGKFALPIEKTQSGVYIVILRPVEDTFKFITSYDVSSQLINRAQAYPENGLNIGVIEYVEEPREITSFEDDIPDSVKIVDDEEYWTCGEEESEYKYKHESYNNEVKFKVEDANDDTFQGNTISFGQVVNTIGGIFSGLIPGASSELYRGDLEGRAAYTAGTSYRSTMGTLGFLNGIMNRFEPTSGTPSIPNCSEFLKTKYDDTGDFNKNYYTFNGLSSLELPLRVEDKLDKKILQEDVLNSKVACVETDGTEKTYLDLAKEGYEYIGQISLGGELFNDQNLTSVKINSAIDNDSMENEDNDNVPRVVPFPEEEILGRGSSPAATEAEIRFPKVNEVNYNLSDTLVEDAIYKTTLIDEVSSQDPNIYIYEMGPYRSLCSISEIRENNGTGQKIVENEDRESILLSETDRTAVGWKLTNSLFDNQGIQVGDQIEFYEDPITGNVVMKFLSGLVSIFKSFLAPGNPMDSCFEPVDPDNPEAYTLVTADECEAIQEEYGQPACEEVILTDGTGFEYRRYRNFSYNCTGEMEYDLNFRTKQVDEGNIEIKGNTPNKNAENIRESLRLDVGAGGETPLTIGKAAMELYQLTGSDGPVLKIKRDITSPSTDTLDYLRFSAMLPDGSETTELPYNSALIRLIDREQRQKGDTNILAGSNTIGGGTGGGVSVDITADCAPVSNLTYFNQAMGSWSNYQWGPGPTCTMGYWGCGPTTVSMVLNKVNDMNPYGVATTYYSDEDPECDGTSTTSAVNAYRAAGINATEIGYCNAIDLQDAICSDNKLVMVLGQSCSDSSCSKTVGHFILATGTNLDENNFTVMDPFYSNVGTQTFDNSNNGLGTLRYYDSNGYICIIIDTDNLQ